MRNPDPSARRQAVALVVLGALMGALLLSGVGTYSAMLRDWIAAEPRDFGHRVRVVFGVLAALVSLPLLAFSGYLWWLGARVTRVQEFPPPGHRVIRKTRVLGGIAATRRGRVLKGFALGLAAAAVMSSALLWQLAATVDRAIR